MCIECYYSDCPNHSIHDNPEEGPFCYEEKCCATEEDIARYMRARNTYLAEISDNILNLKKGISDND